MKIVNTHVSSVYSQNATMADGISSLKDVTDVLKISSEKLSTALDVAKFVSDSQTCVKLVMEDIQNGNVTSSFFQSISGLIDVFEYVLEKMSVLSKAPGSKEIPFWGLAAAMATFVATEKAAQEEYSSIGFVTQEKIDDMVLNFIDVLSGIVKSVCVFIPGVNVLVSTPFFGIADYESACLKTLYLTRVHDEKNIGLTLADQWLGNIDDMFIDIIYWISGKTLTYTDSRITNGESGRVYNFDSRGVLTITENDGSKQIFNTKSNLSVVMNATRLSNYGSSVTIAGTAGDDTIFSHLNASKNAVRGGVGDDFVVIYDESSTVFGGAGNDKIAVYGGRNVLYGDDGMDFFLINSGAGRNTIIGREGNDIIALEDSDTQIIVYNSGDGNDVVFGYDDNDRISIPVKYNTTVSGDNVVITVGDGAMTLMGVRGKNININDKVISTSDTQIGGATQRGGVVTIPGFWDDNKVIRGTSKNDLIVNNVMGAQIEAGFGNDSVRNFGASVTIDGSAGDDFISNEGNFVEIIGGDGNDSIDNEVKGSPAGGSNVTLIGGNGNDSIKNDGGNVIISGSSGNDSIENWAESVSISGDEGADKIYSSGSNMTIDSGSDDDIVFNGGYYDNNGYYANGGSNVLINGGLGNDSIYNEGNSVTINGGAGEDTIKCGNWIDTISISGGIGNDSILSELTGFATIDGGAGSDTIFVNGHDIKIFGGTDNDFIKSEESNDVTINAGEGNDTIHNIRKWRSSINGNEGNDVIFNDACNYVTITGGIGNDSIKNSGDNVLFQYTLGDGEDTIHGFRLNNTLQIFGGIYSTLVSGNDVIVKVGNGSITLKDGKDILLNIQGTLSGGGSTVSADTIPAGISINGAMLTASTVFTNNKIDLNDYASTVTKINASALSRAITIIGSAANNSIKGGRSDDTIWGGYGNDTVSLGTGADVYIYNGGNDFIQDYVAGQDKIKLVGSSITGSSLSGSNVVLKTSEGNITVKSGKDKNITVIDSAGKEVTQVYPVSTLSAGISISNATLTASTAFTGNIINLAEYASTVTKVNASALSRGISIVGTATANSLKGGKGADTILGGAGKDTISLGAGADVYIYTSGDDLIQDYTVGADKISLASASIVGASISGSNVVLKTSGGNITVKSGKGKQITVIDKNGNETSQIYPIETLLAGLSYDSAKKILTVGTDYSGTTIDMTNLATTTKTVDASKFAKALKIIGSTRADSLIGGSKADTLIGGKGNDTFRGSGGNDIFVYASGDGNDVIADFTTGDKISLNGASVTSASLKSSDMIFKIANGNITVKGGKDKDISIGSAIYFNNLVYDSKKSAMTLGNAFSGSLKSSDYMSTVKKIDASGVSKSINIVGNAQSNTIIGSSKAETIYGGTSNDSINGEAGNDRLYGDAGNDKLVGGAGSDTLYGGAGNDTFTGNEGNDIFIYEDGNDVITDYVSGQDKIKLMSNLSITGAAISGSNVILKVGTGSITVKEGKNKNITVINSQGKETANIYPLDTLPAGISVKSAVLTASTVFSGNKIDLVDYASTVTKVNASALSRGIAVVGSSAANSLKGGSGADTISGGAGNDTVSLGAGNDIYVYSSGNDLIQDYTVGQDKIKLVGSSITSSSLSGSNIILTTSSGVITIKGGKGKKLTVIDSSGKETSRVYPIVTLPVGISINGAVVTASTAFTGNKIDLAEYDSTVTKVNASSLSRGISIIGNSAANSLKGGKGDDTICGGIGNDTVSLGAGNDVYVYSGGNDVIQDYKANEDKIQLSKVSITGASVSGYDVVLKTSDGGITVKNGNSKAITVIDSNNIESTQIYPTITEITLPAGLEYDSTDKILIIKESYDGSFIDLSSLVANAKTVFAGNFLRNLKITGNSLGNEIIGGKGLNTLIGGSGSDTLYGNSNIDCLSGGFGNDTLSGMAGDDKLFGGIGDDSLSGGSGRDMLFGDPGNDTLYGGSDNDYFYYESGNDVIVDYEVGKDWIYLTNGSVTKSSISGSDVILTIGSSGTLTIKKGQNKYLTIVSNGIATQKIYSNEVFGSNSAISSTSKLWFTEDDTNFIENTSQIDDIFFTIDEYAVPKFHTTFDGLNSNYINSVASNTLYNDSLKTDSTRLQGLI